MVRCLEIVRPVYKFSVTSLAFWCALVPLAPVLVVDAPAIHTLKMHPLSLHIYAAPAPVSTSRGPRTGHWTASLPVSFCVNGCLPGWVCEVWVVGWRGWCEGS